MQIIKNTHLNTPMTCWPVESLYVFYWSGGTDKHMSVGSDTRWRPSHQVHSGPFIRILPLFLSSSIFFSCEVFSPVIPFVPLLPQVSNRGQQHFFLLRFHTSWQLEVWRWGRSLWCGGRKWSWVWLCAEKPVKTHVCCRNIFFSPTL